MLLPSTNLVFQHFIGLHTILVENLRNGFDTNRRDSDLEIIRWPGCRVCGADLDKENNQATSRVGSRELVDATQSVRDANNFLEYSQRK
jgi:hypothetical protein